MPLTSDVGLDPLTFDLPVFPVHISGVDLIVQRMTIRLQRFLGEWILDTTVGIPYLAFIQERPVDVEGITAVLRTEIETTPGVLRVDDFIGVFVIASQTLRFTGLIRLEDDESSRCMPVLGTSARFHVACQKQRDRADWPQWGLF